MLRKGLPITDQEKTKSGIDRRSILKGLAGTAAGIILTGKCYAMLANTKDSMSNSLRVFTAGAAKVDITPDPDVTLKGTNAGGGEFASSSMKFSYSRVEMESQFSGLDSALKDGAKLTVTRPNDDLDSIEDAIKKFEKDKINSGVDSAISLAQRSASAISGNAKFGNVYGAANRLNAALSNGQSLLGALQGAAVQEETVFGNSPTFSLGGNPLGEGVQPSNSLPTDKIFSPAPSGPSLGTDNIFGQ